MRALALLWTACSPEQAVGNSGEDAAPPAPPTPPGWSVAPVDLLPCGDMPPSWAGAWIVGCDAAGDWFAEGPDGRLALDRPAGPVALADGVLVSVGFGGFRQRFGEPAETLPHASAALVAAPQTDGVHLALAYADHVELFTLGDTRRVHVPARPVPGEPIALSWPLVVWVERGDGLDLRTVDAAGAPVDFATGPGDQRQPVGAPTGIAWVDDGAVRWRVGTTERTLPADAGFGAPPTTDGVELCWEDRGAWRARGGALDDARGVEIRCADGGALDAEGDDLHPRVRGDTLLWTSSDRTWLARRDAP